MMRQAGALLLALALFGCSRAPVGQVIDGPLAKGQIEEAWQHVLPPRASLGDNALRTVIEPSFSDFVYAIDYAPQPRNCLTPHGGTVDELAKVERRFCRDVLVRYYILERAGRGPGAVVRQWTFHLPVEEWRNLAVGLDRRMDEWTGERLRIADGTAAALERVRGGHVRSVRNNFATYGSPLNPAYFAQTEAQRLLLLYGPANVVPRPTNWTVRRNLDPAWPCDNESFVNPDPDGWGIGNDACAVKLKGK